MTDEQPDGKGQNIRDSNFSKDSTLLLLHVLLFKRIVICMECDKTTATSGSRVGRIRRPPSLSAADLAPNAKFPFFALPLIAILIKSKL